MSKIYLFISKADKLVRLTGTNEHQLIDLAMRLGFNPDTHELYSMVDGKNSRMSFEGMSWYLRPAIGDKVSMNYDICHVSHRKPNGNWMVELEGWYVAEIAYLGINKQTNSPVWRFAG